MKARILALALLALALLALACASGQGPAADAKASNAQLRKLREEQGERNAALEPLKTAPAPTVASRLREGDALKEADQPGRALWRYLQAARLDPADPRPMLRIGSLHLSADPTRSEQIFRELVKRQPRSADAQTGLALALIAQGKREQAEELLRSALAREPDHAAALNALGVVLDRRGRHAEARGAWNHAWSVQPRSHVALNNLGSSYLVTGDFEAARSVLERAAKLESRDPAVWNNLGLALARLGREHDALAAFRKAGTEQAALNNMGYASFLAGDYTGALSWYERALLVSGPLVKEIQRNVVALERARVAHQAPVASQLAAAHVESPPGVQTPDPMNPASGGLLQSLPSVPVR